MHYNPCGRAVDWIQFPFEVDARLHASEDAPLVRLRWLFTDMPFLPVGTGCVVNNRIWNADKASDLLVGMLPPSTNNYEQDARWTLPPGFTSDHLCHSDWFAVGEPWPVTLPPTEYDSYWIPTCCAQPNNTATGGVMIGGAVAHTWAVTHAPTGGVMFGGDVSQVYTVTHAPTGGVVFGGDVSQVYTIEHSPSGGVEFGGLVQHNEDFQNTARGGVVFGGDVSQVYTVTHAPTGGVVFGGDVVHAFGFEHDAAGGVMFAGLQTHAYTIEHAPTGGVELGGDVVHAFGFTHSPTGGVVFGGAVTHTYNPGGPTPGSTCATAGAITPGQSYSGTAPGTPNDDWFVFTPTAGTQYTVTISGSATNNERCQAVTGSCPNPTTPQFIPFQGNGSKSWTASTAAPVFLKVGEAVGGAYTIHLTSP